MQWNMIKHIHEIPEALTRNLVEARADVAAACEMVRKDKPQLIVVSGCGASYHDAVAARFAFESLTNIPTVAIPAAELSLYPACYFGPGRVVILISRSGEKRDVMLAARKVRESGGVVIGITATPDSLLAAESDTVILTHEGSEHCQPKTKSYICILGTLLQLAVQLMDDPGRSELLSEELLRVPDLIERIITEQETPMKQLASKMSSCRGAYITGSGCCHGSALESALKLKETSFLNAEAFTTGEVTQGPMLLLDESWMYVSLLLESERELAARVIDAAGKWGAFTLAITQEDRGLSECCDIVVQVPSCGNEVFASMTHIIPLYLLAYYLALEKGLDPDNPMHFDRILELILEPGRHEPEMRQGSIEVQAK
jgi:glucosamine--fructose-6-phosphate aminotransferase (isomerizing)